jgi:FlaA1/EpsC-like NDP-sugar epimerase
LTIERLHRLRLATPLCHILIVGLSYWLAWLLRFDFVIPAWERGSFYRGFMVLATVKLVLFFATGLHRESWWRHQSLSDLSRLAFHNLLDSAVSTVLIFIVVGAEFPRSVYILDLLLCFLFSGAGRLSVGFQREIRASRQTHKGAKGLLIYGAGVSGIALAREIRDNPKLGYRVIGFLDDDPRKHGSTLMGLPVFGPGNQAKAVLETSRKRKQKIDEIAVSMPSASGRQIRLALAKGKRAGVRCRIVPGLGELISGTFAVANRTEISVTDLLGREQVDLDVELVRRSVAGRSVLVTGAAGSIGTELCCQIAQFGPRLLVALDQAESELFRLEADLTARFPSQQIAFEVGDIRDARQVETIIEEHAVNSIYHAAAYKHVPLMERQVCEAVRNNVLGTWNLVQAAWRAGVSNVLLISTDKAVNPTSIMGLTKRICELLVCAQRSRVAVADEQTRCISVRFGNVLVSNGSVVPIFQKQIASGGPVTVTHPDMRRYFMTVSEAVALVLQASAMGKGSELFVLDMGTPVRIVDLARRMITLSGFVPDEDIEIRFTGARPGEKIVEELHNRDENTLPTAHPKIRSFQGRKLGLQELAPWIAELQHLVWRRDSKAIVEHMKILVPEYDPRAAASVAPEELKEATVTAAAKLAGPELARA